MKDMYGIRPEDFGPIASQLARVLDEWKEKELRLLQDVESLTSQHLPQVHDHEQSSDCSSDEYSDSDCSDGDDSEDDLMDTDDDEVNDLQDPLFTSQATPVGSFHVQLQSTVFQQLTDVDLS